MMENRSEHVVLRSVPSPQVLCLTLNRPAKRNAISELMRQALIAELRDPQTASCRVLILHGAGGVFSAGADLTETAQISNQQRLSSWDALMQTLDDVPVPVIAAVEGLAYGAGFELALACDMIVAAEDTRFALPEVKYGFLPGSGGTQRLVRAVGKHRAMAIILATEPIDAAEALARGVASMLCKSGAALETAAALAERIASYPAQAVNNARRAIVDGMDLPLADGLRIEREMLLPLLETRLPNHWDGS